MKGLNRGTLTLALVLLTSGVASPLAAAHRPLSDADRVELSRIEALLADPENAERSSAARALLGMASRYPQPPAELAAMLLRASSDGDPAIAGTVGEALYRMQNPSAAGEQLRETRAEMARRTMDRIARLLDDERAPERSDAGRALVNLAGLEGELSYELRFLLERARSDADRRIARPAEAFLARHDGLSPAAAQPAARAPHWRERDEAHEAMVTEVAARTSLYVGPAALAVDPGNQPPSAEASYATPAAGFVDAAGVFVGVSVADAKAKGAQPPSPEAHAGVQQQGYYDEAGVFIGVEQPAAIEAATEQPQP